MMTESLFSKESIQLLLSLIDNSLQTSCIQFINDCRNSVAGQEILPVAGCQWKRKNIQSIL